MELVTSMHSGSHVCNNFPKSTRLHLKPSQFRKVPVEIVEAIFRFLLYSDQICFALSCRGIYAIYIQQKALNFVPSSRLESAIHGIDLRLRLQNKHWIYCTQCSLPHWHSMWHTIRSFLGLNHKHPNCRPSYQVWHRPPFTGQVDICPCFSMTFYKHQLYTYLCRNPNSVSQDLQKYILTGPNIGCDEKFVDFTHKCIFTNHPLVEARIKTTFWFDEASKTFRVLNRFKFDISKAGSSHLGPFGRTSSNLCLHKDTKGWLQDFFRLSKSNFHINTQDHSWCQWLGWDTPYIFEIILHRNLGNSKWPDRRWKSHCHN